MKNYEIQKKCRKDYLLPGEMQKTTSQNLMPQKMQYFEF